MLGSYLMLNLKNIADIQCFTCDQALSDYFEKWLAILEARI